MELLLKNLSSERSVRSSVCWDQRRRQQTDQNVLCERYWTWTRTRTVLCERHWTRTRASSVRHWTRTRQSSEETVLQPA
ncbi:hypothetical protein WMY93_015674 [Mugilogobius chulae]|uniref:Uncharacterized protein n=1 Tax=Mugilogobius chulae TaxID=88201 RepID=A0AAW0NRU8_9GOBI